MRPDIPYVGVTGSCGKTTTTRLIGAVLSQVGEVRTDAGRNGPSRVLENILAIGAKTKFCVQELSGSRPDRIRLQVKSLRPQIGVVTTVGSDHYKNFRSLEATAQEKSRLVAFLRQRGTAILNADDPHVLAMRERTRARVLTYGVPRDADIRAEDVRSAWPDRLSLTVIARTTAPAAADPARRRVLDYIDSRRDRLRSRAGLDLETCVAGRRQV